MSVCDPANLFATPCIRCFSGFPQYCSGIEDAPCFDCVKGVVHFCKREASAKEKPYDGADKATADKSCRYKIIEDQGNEEVLEMKKEEKIEADKITAEKEVFEKNKAFNQAEEILRNAEFKTKNMDENTNKALKGKKSIKHKSNAEKSQNAEVREDAEDNQEKAENKSYTKREDISLSENELKEQNELDNKKQCEPNAAKKYMVKPLWRLVEEAITMEEETDRNTTKRKQLCEVNAKGFKLAKTLEEKIKMDPPSSKVSCQSTHEYRKEHSNEEHSNENSRDIIHQNKLENKEKRFDKNLKIKLELNKKCSDANLFKPEKSKGVQQVKSEVQEKVSIEDENYSQAEEGITSYRVREASGPSWGLRAFNAHWHKDKLPHEARNRYENKDTKYSDIKLEKTREYCNNSSKENNCKEEKVLQIKPHVNMFPRQKISKKAVMNHIVKIERCSTTMQTENGTNEKQNDIDEKSPKVKIKHSPTTVTAKVKTVRDDSLKQAERLDNDVSKIKVEHKQDILNCKRRESQMIEATSLETEDDYSRAIEEDNKNTKEFSFLRSTKKFKDKPGGSVLELEKTKVDRTIHCDGLEFVAEEEKIYIPYWMTQSLMLDQGGLIQMESATIPIATAVKFQPQSVDFVELTKLKAVLEMRLRHFAYLSTGNMAVIDCNDKIDIKLGIHEESANHKRLASQCAVLHVSAAMMEPCDAILSSHTTLKRSDCTDVINSWETITRAGMDIPMGGVKRSEGGSGASLTLGTKFYGYGAPPQDPKTKEENKVHGTNFREF